MRPYTRDGTATVTIYIPPGAKRPTESFARPTVSFENAGEETVIMQKNRGNQNGRSDEKTRGGTEAGENAGASGTGSAGSAAGGILGGAGERGTTKGQMPVT